MMHSDPPGVPDTWSDPAAVDVPAGPFGVPAWIGGEISLEEVIGEGGVGRVQPRLAALASATGRGQGPSGCWRCGQSCCLDPRSPRGRRAAASRGGAVVPARLGRGGRARHRHAGAARGELGRPAHSRRWGTGLARSPARDLGARVRSGRLCPLARRAAPRHQAAQRDARRVRRGRPARLGPRRGVVRGAGRIRASPRGCPASRRRPRSGGHPRIHGP